MQENYHILVVDDDARLRKLLVAYLCEAGFFVSDTPDTVEAKAFLHRFTPDAMVVDVMMPNQDGYSFARELRAAGVATPLLLLTAMGEAEHRIQGFEAGADDYLAKPFEPRELTLRLQALLKRARNVTPAHDTVRFGLFSYDKTTQSLSRDGQAIPLTLAERALLHTLASQAGQVVSRDALMAALQPTASPDAALDSRAVDVHLMRLRRKLGDDPKQPLHLHTLRGKGYRLYV